MATIIVQSAVMKVCGWYSYQHNNIVHLSV